MTKITVRSEQDAVLLNRIHSAAEEFRARASALRLDTARALDRLDHSQRPTPSASAGVDMLVANANLAALLDVAAGLRVGDDLLAQAVRAGDVDFLTTPPTFAIEAICIPESAVRAALTAIGVPPGLGITPWQDGQVGVTVRSEHVEGFAEALFTAASSSEFDNWTDFVAWAEQSPPPIVEGKGSVVDVRWPGTRLLRLVHSPAEG